MLDQVDLRRAQLREQRRQRRVRHDRSRLGPAVQLPALRTARIEAAVLTSRQGHDVNVPPLLRPKSVGLRASVAVAACLLLQAAVSLSSSIDRNRATLDRLGRCRAGGITARAARRCRIHLPVVCRAAAPREPRARARRRPRSPRLLPAPVDPIHETAPDRAGAERQGPRRKAGTASARGVPEGGRAPDPPVPEAARTRVAAVVRALESPGTDPRLVYFRELVDRTFPAHGQREAAIVGRVPARDALRLREGVRRAAIDGWRLGGLGALSIARAEHRYRGRGRIPRAPRPRACRRRSSPTAGSGGCSIVGPGLDLGPRTALVEDGPPESYQPWAVDRRARLARALPPRRARCRRRGHQSAGGRAPPPRQRAAADADAGQRALRRRTALRYRAITAVTSSSSDAQSARVNEGPGQAAGHLRKRVRVHDPAIRALHAETLDIVTDRFDGAALRSRRRHQHPALFRRCVLTLALTNIAAMLAPGGVSSSQRGEAARSRSHRAAGPSVRAIAARDHRHCARCTGAALRQRVPSPAAAVNTGPLVFSLRSLALVLTGSSWLVVRRS